MVRKLCLLLGFCGSLSAVWAQGIASVAGDPYKLAKFVETHYDFEWEPLWTSLNINEAAVFLPRCEQAFKGVASCRSELITVVDPLQVLVLIEHDPSQFQVILRYESSGVGLWRFSGAYAPSVKYFAPEHRILRFGDKPFLVVTEQGNAGTGLSSKVESWIDLTAEHFRPVLSFTTDGEKMPWPDGIGVKVHGLVASLEVQPVERVTVSMTVEFTVLDDHDELRIGQRHDMITYVRGGNGNFKVNERLSTGTAQQVESFYGDLDSGFTDDEFLRFNFAGLMAVAKGKDEKTRAWLWRFLQRCSDSTESRQIQAAMGAPR